MCMEMYVKHVLLIGASTVAVGDMRSRADSGRSNSGLYPINAVGLLLTSIFFSIRLLTFYFSIPIISIRF